VDEVGYGQFDTRPASYLKHTVTVLGRGRYLFSIPWG